MKLYRLITLLSCCFFVAQIFSQEHKSKFELKTEQGYWIYDTENKAIYADEALTDIKNPDNRIDAEYTSDKKYFYAGMWDVMDYGPQAGLEVYIVEVYKRVL